MTEMFSNPASTKTLSMFSGLCCFAGWLFGAGGMSVSSFVFKNFAVSSVGISIDQKLMRIG